MAEATPVERGLIEAVQAMVDEAPARTADVIARALESRGIRCLLVASGAVKPPSVVVTLTIDDVTAEAVRRVVIPVLRKAGMSEEAIPMMAGSAGTFVSQWLSKQRAQRQQQQAAVGEAPPQGPPRWQPGRRRAGG